jgi:glycerol-3-phosphate dehydrogenase
MFKGDHGLDTAEALLELYDELQPLKGGRPHVRLSADEARTLVSGLSGAGLRGAVTFDEWAVDARALVAAVIADGVRAGARVLQGEVASFKMPRGRVEGAVLSDGREISARVVVNAAGPWADRVAALAGARVPLTLRKGVHLVLPGDHGRWAVLFRDETGRTLGLYPRPGEAWVGPTDDAFEGDPAEAAPTEAELSRLRRAVERALPGLGASGLTGVAGVRPIVAGGPVGWLLSRDYRVFDHAEEGIGGLVTVTGGKLVLFRKMGEEAVDAAERMLCASSA